MREKEKDFDTLASDILIELYNDIKSHARMALAMVAKHGTPEEKKKVRAAVARKFPGIKQED